jgi:hypothetical protein
MNEHLSRDEREALIAGERQGALGPDEAAEVGLLADLLASPSTWAQPPASLEAAVVRAVGEAEPTVSKPAPTVWRRRRVLWTIGVASALAVALVVGAAVVTGTKSSPQYAVELSSTGLAPGAHASVTITRTDAGFRVNLDARGLARLENGEFYQAWLKDAAGTLVPIGTFSSSNNRVTLWSGVSPHRFSTLTVTIESNDNDQTSSGRRVLVGDVHAR